MAKKNNQTAYFGLPWIISLILAIIPITSVILGPVVAFQRGNMVGLVVRLIVLIAAIGLSMWIPFVGLVGLVIWILDIIAMVIHKDLKWLA